jgi:hypothetical protein
MISNMEKVASQLATAQKTFSGLNQVKWKLNGTNGSDCKIQEALTSLEIGAFMWEHVCSFATVFPIGRSRARSVYYVEVLPSIEYARLMKQIRNTTVSLELYDKDGEEVARYDAPFHRYPDDGEYSWDGNLPVNQLSGYDSRGEVMSNAWEATTYVVETKPRIFADDGMVAVIPAEGDARTMHLIVSVPPATLTAAEQVVVTFEVRPQ